jgi:hypothetical protein
LDNTHGNEAHNVAILLSDLDSGIAARSFGGDIVKPARLSSGKVGQLGQIELRSRTDDHHNVAVFCKRTASTVGECDQIFGGQTGDQIGNALLSSIEANLILGFEGLTDFLNRESLTGQVPNAQAGLVEAVILLGI